MRCRSSLLTLALAVVLFGCARQAPGKDLTLPSGRHIKVISAGNHYMLKSGEKDWMLQYETTLDLQNIDALRREAGEIWDIFSAEAEKAGRSAAVLMAEVSVRDAGSNLPGLSVKEGKLYPFYLTRGADGVWRGAEGQPLAPPDFQRVASLAASRFENGEYASRSSRSESPEIWRCSIARSSSTARGGRAVTTSTGRSCRTRGSIAS